MNTLDILNDILVKELKLSDERIWAYNSDVDIPKDGNLFVVLFMTSQKPHANNIKYVPTKSGLNEVQTINLVQDIIIALISKNADARNRAYEIPLALNSTYSQQVQTKNRIHISTIGEIYDMSFLEATSMLNRFDCKIRVFTSYEKINNVDYYDKFSLDIWTQGQNSSIIKTTIQGEQ